MKTGKNIILIAAAMLMFCSLDVFAQNNAVIKSIRGKVEVRQPGSEWTPASPGQEIAKGTVISTGFNSDAVIDLGRSEVLMRQLTRISIEELSLISNQASTEINLRLGKVSAEVKPVEGLMHDFTLSTPVATASVRGTKFDAGVNTIEVKEGKVAYYNKIGQKTSVARGGSSSVALAGYSTPAGARESIITSARVMTSTVTEAGTGIENLIAASSGILSGIEIAELTITFYVLY